MATSKAKRLINLAQPQPRQAKSGLAGGPKPQRRKLNPKTNDRMSEGARPEGKAVAPVKAHVYRSIAELNGGFEKVVQ